MKNIARIAILSTAVLATTLASFSVADARKRYPYWRHHHAGHVSNRAFVAGTVGLAAGVVIGSAIVSQRPRYVQPRTVYVAPGPVYEGPVGVYDGPVDDWDGPDQAYAEPDGYQPGDDQGYERYDDRATGQDDDQAIGQDYFPEKPRRNGEDAGDSRQAGAVEPWSREWRDYCEGRYRTFNPKTGTYRGIDGQDHFCTAG
jgi:hypothetical protein